MYIFTYHKQILHLIYPSSQLFCHKQKFVGCSGHFGKKTHSLHMLKENKNKNDISSPQSSSHYVHNTNTLKTPLQQLASSDSSGQSVFRSQRCLER